MIPNSQHRLIVGDKIDSVWLRFLQSLDGKADASDISAIASALGSPDGTVANIPDLSANTVRILQAAGIAVTRGTEGEYYIALRPLGDSGEGTFKLITRDTTGRISGSEDGTAADVPYDPTASGLTATDTQAAIDELQAEKLGDAPSDGSEYVRKNGAWEVASASAGGAMTLVGAVEITGSAATAFPQITGLDLATDGRYLMQFSIQNATASAVTLAMQINGDTTAGNYYSHSITAGTSGSPSIFIGANNLLAGVDASGYVDGTIVMQARVDGKPIATCDSRRSSASAISLNQVFTTMRNNTANMTTLDVASDVANSLAIGSYIKVFKVG